ncbi:hypothetical protein, partial [Pseudochryseolinea flava]
GRTYPWQVAPQQSLASVLVQQHKIQISKLYLQPVQIHSHFQFTLYAGGDTNQFIYTTLNHIAVTFCKLILGDLVVMLVTFCQ